MANSRSPWTCAAPPESEAPVDAMSSKTASAADDPVARLLAGYRPIPGVPDELLGPDGRLRPVWGRLVAALASMDEEEIAMRRSRGDLYMRDAGVFFRQYGKPAAGERDWPLSHVPVLIDESEWAGIAKGLSQRADLLERVMADVYGPNRLIVDGLLPAAVVADNPEWLRPLVGAKPRSGHFLHFVAFDIGRGPGGRWWVLGDRTQAPSGAGFALENRIATARVYADHYARANVHRLAGFFRMFRDALNGMRGAEESRVAILTPGPHNDTYFEHAYIARYLGFMLLEGEDLVVRNGDLMVRTVAGLRPVSVLWRRLDSSWADPLELREGSKLGTPGMLGAVRAGNVTMVNALGSGVLEARAFLAFLPAIAEELTGEALAMPNIATWWCGQQAERDYVMANAASMTIGDAFSTRPLFDSGDMAEVAGKNYERSPEELAAMIERGAGQLVGQEAVMLSTAPAFGESGLEPRPMSLRVFLARMQGGWQAMPGGFARIGRAGDAPVLAMQHGGSAADVWVVSKRAVRAETMFASPAAPFTRQQPSVLPARAADNLFWLGRYVERAENAIRLLRAYHSRLAEASSGGTPLLRSMAEYLSRIDADPEGGLPEGVAATLASATNAAGHVRDRFSIDGWLALADLGKTVGRMRVTATPGDDMARAMGVLLRKLSGFSGLVHENMYRFTGWRFLSIGRSLERAISLAALLAEFTDEEAPEGSLDLAIEVADSIMTHRRRYAVATSRATVADLLALDPLNPRAVIYQLNEISEHLDYLPGNEAHRQLSDLQRAMLRTRTDLAIHTPETLDSEVLSSLHLAISGLSELIGQTYLR